MVAGFRIIQSYITHIQAYNLRENGWKKYILSEMIQIRYRLQAIDQQPKLEM